MKTDAEIKYEGMNTLLKYMDNLDAERFITLRACLRRYFSIAKSQAPRASNTLFKQALIKRENFDYTKWRQNLFIGMTGREISKAAMEYQKNLKDVPIVK